MLIRWVREASKEERKKLLRAISGAGALGNKPITITHTSQSLPHFYTCFNQLDLHNVTLPTRGEDEEEALYELFAKRLTTGIEEALAEGFGML